MFLFADDTLGKVKKRCRVDRGLSQDVLMAVIAGVLGITLGKYALAALVGLAPRYSWEPSAAGEMNC